VLLWPKAKANTEIHSEGRLPFFRPFDLNGFPFRLSPAAQAVGLFFPQKTQVLKTIFIWLP
jgi:hypothetical protein